MSVSGSPPAGVNPGAVLDRLDAQLGEIGRRQHRFAWLRDPTSGEWIAVAAYYPGNRVVVLAGADRALQVLAEDLVPRNGLFLVTVSEEEQTGAVDGDTLAKTLRARLEIAGWEPRSVLPRRGVAPMPAAPTGPAPVLPPPPTRTGRPAADDGRDFDEFESPRGASATTARGTRTAAPSPARVRSARTSGSEGIGVGVTLVLAAALELGLGGGLIGLAAGQYVLGFGLVLDACARVLGMIAASQSGDLDAAWTAVLFGSPALWRLKDSRQPGDVAPVARLTAGLAACVVALGLLLWIV